MADYKILSASVGEDARNSSGTVEPAGSDKLTWGLSGDRTEKVYDPSRGSTLTIQYYDSEDGVCRTAFASVSGQVHECRKHSIENAWKFISRFTR